MVAQSESCGKKGASSGNLDLSARSARLTKTFMIRDLMAEESLRLRRPLDLLLLEFRGMEPT